jgi:hypothetical protein
MGWLKLKGIASPLALMALALQFALTFGHVHLDKVYRPHMATAGASVQSQQLPQQNRGGDGDEYCAVCATIYLAANSFVSHAPLLPAPPVSQAIRHIHRVTAIAVVPRRTPFQSRAPPLA